MNNATLVKILSGAFLGRDLCTCVVGPNYYVPALQTFGEGTNTQRNTKEFEAHDLPVTSLSENVEHGFFGLHITKLDKPITNQYCRKSWWRAAGIAKQMQLIPQVWLPQSALDYPEFEHFSLPTQS